MCKRPSLRPSRKPREPETPIGSRIATLAMGVGTVCALGAAIAFGFDLVPQAPREDATVIQPVREAPAVSASVAENAKKAEQLRAQIAANEALLLAAQQQQVLDAMHQAQLQQQAAAQTIENLRGKPLEPGAATKPEAAVAPEKLQLARKRVPIVMYSTTWCPVCTKARNYFTSAQIDFSERDVDQSPTAKLAMKRLNPRGGVPTIDIDGDVIVGFSAQAIEHAIDSAAKKRVQQL